MADLKTRRGRRIGRRAEEVYVGTGPEGKQLYKRDFTSEGGSSESAGWNNDRSGNQCLYGVEFWLCPDITFLDHVQTQRHGTTISPNDVGADKIAQAAILQSCSFDCAPFVMVTGDQAACTEARILRDISTAQ